MSRKRKITEQAKQHLSESDIKDLALGHFNQEKRDENICLLHAQGMPITEIGKLYRISRQRVSQILYSIGISAKEDKKEIIDVRELEEWKAKASKYLERARKNRELLRTTSLDLMNTKRKLEHREGVIKELRQEIAELKRRKEEINYE